MEWTKEKLIGTCIKCMNRKHGERIIEFYKSHGFNVHSNTGKCIGYYYGIVVCSNLFACFETKKYFSKEIKLPVKPRRKFPREMMVSQNGKEWWKRTVVCKVPKRKEVVALFHPGEQSVCIWKYAKEID